MAGLLRVTQEYTAVVGSDPGDLRVSQHYVSVLSPSTLALDAESTLSLTQLVQEGERAENTLALTQALAVNFALSVFAENTLSLTHAEITGGPKSAAAVSTITITQETISSLKTPFAENTITIEVSTRDAIITEVEESQSLVFTQEAISSLKTPFATNAAVFIQLTFDGTAFAGALEGTGENTLTLSQVAQKSLIKAAALDLSASNTLTLSHIPRLTLELDTEVGVLTFTQSAVAEVVKPAENLLLLSQTAIAQVTINREISQVLELVHAFNYEEEE